MNLARWIRAAALPILGGLLLAGGLMLTSPGTASAASNASQLAVPSEPDGNKACLECHSKNETMNRDGKEISIHVNGAEYAESVHGIISCVRCHAEAGPEHAADPNKPLNLPTGRELAVLKSQGCVKCHAGPYEESYNLSFHGVAVANGDNRAATCVDCHGVHNILPSRNTASAVSPENLAGTCGTAECHQGAPENFAKGKEHVIASEKSAPASLHLVYKFFMILILFDTMKDGPIVMFELLRRLQAGRGH
ncbi:MAG: doubled protein [Symbiobacteriaceae bacterium]|nr:doubled protein [Symbiobacteriaceae bacterium]